MFTLKDLEKSSTAVRLSIDNTIAPEHLENAERLLKLIEEIERLCGKILLTSAYRSLKLNTAVKGSKTSAHCKCLAIDFEVPGRTNLEVCNRLRERLKDYDQIIYEFGEYGWVHVGLSETSNRKQQLSAIKKGGKTLYSVGF